MRTDARRPASRRILAALILAGGACAPGCDDTVIARSGAPGGRHEAVLLRRACGATTGSSTQVAVLGPGEAVSDARIVFSADDDHGRAAADAGATLAWLAADHLVVSHDARARLFRQSGEAGGVRISVRAVGR